ncbi:MAG: cysteine hydrolase [Planctomycetes bacterium]|nr:cysteine hydrolase [Planctomycetota bacterium]
MTLQLLEKRRTYLLVDIDTQRDFLLDRSDACIKNHRKISASIRSVMAWARRENIQIISINGLYCNNNGCNNIDYHLDSTDGQKKIRYTLLGNRASLPADDSDFMPVDLVQKHRQVILHRRCIDPFDEPKIERLLSEIQADEFILIGVGTEDAVKATALGLLQRGKSVRIVVDALGSHNVREAKLALRKMKTKGAKLLTTKSFAGISQKNKYVSEVGSEEF